jgi:hypothetical protein
MIHHAGDVAAAFRDKNAWCRLGSELAQEEVEASTLSISRRYSADFFTPRSVAFRA